MLSPSVSPAFFIRSAPVRCEARFGSAFARRGGAIAARLLWALGVLFSLASSIAHAASNATFGFDDVDTRARQLAASAYRPQIDSLPADLRAISADAYKDIRFRPDHAVWRKEGLPFELMFFHAGRGNNLPVQINEITLKGIRPIKFDRADFDYGRNAAAASSWGSPGFSGFRIHQALNSPSYKDEVMSFQGASYFRAIGRNLNYGVSARGLGIDMLGGSSEEFPRFSTFWFERPKENAQSLVFFALMESPRLAGAYRFELHPGAQTAVDVRARVYLRSGVASFGIAPLNSMFYSGENQPAIGEFRPEVHDSDGLSIESSSGEWLWRPLLNPSKPITTSFSLPGIKGFGLMQRDRSFLSYEDVEARFDSRPTAWIVPNGDWGPGRVELLQWPTTDETNDNIVAYWVPQSLPLPGQPIDFAYRILWQGQDGQLPASAWTTQTRTGRGALPLGPEEFQYVVDFVGPSLKSLPPDALVRPVVSGNANVKLTEQNVYPNPATGGWRMTVRLQRIDPLQPIELRAFLQAGSSALTETWTNLIPPR